MPLHPQSASLLAAMEALGAPPLETQEAAKARAGFNAMTVPSNEPIHEMRDLDADAAKDAAE